MADTTNWHMGSVWHLPPSTVRDYCSEIANFLRTNPGAWTQDVGARTGDGTPCHPTNPHARSFCMLGLIERFVDVNMRRQVIEHVARWLPGMYRDMPLHIFNDQRDRTVTEVLRCFESAAVAPEKPAPMVEVPKSKEIYFESNWKQLAMPTAEDIAKYEAEIAALSKKLIPWETIMERIAAEAA